MGSARVGGRKIETVVLPDPGIEKVMDQVLLLGIDPVIEFEGMPMGLGFNPYMDIVLDQARAIVCPSTVEESFITVKPS